MEHSLVARLAGASPWVLSGEPVAYIGFKTVMGEDGVVTIFTLGPLAALRVVRTKTK
ncbi:hypothetical protein [Roseospira marina]|uniref:hypothetical protein n=1 Tax=Roseospira marina TaxID=140057 RepID=UPI00160C8D9A|nr:hypothetical protein [Roseospira marina]MBB4315464.1 hypothetical protein [Roseospira marina]MBB5088390.1 hypothetical protein [Roseospira marina]